VSRKIEGVCRVCDKQTKLTFEHIPPRSSGNDHKVQLYSGVDCVKSSLFGLDSPDGEYVIQQQGMGFVRLCTDCNSLFGRHYVKPYVWLNKDVRSKAKSMRKEMPENGRGYVWLSLHEFMPLAFIKHVISNFCVIDSTGSMEDCREFLLDPESTALSGRYRLRMLIVPEPTKTCMSGWMVLLLGKPGGGIDTIRLACLLVPPFAFVLYDLEHSSLRLDLDGDITSMASIPSDQHPDIIMTLPVMSAQIAAIPAQWMLPTQSINVQ